MTPEERFNEAIQVAFKQYRTQLDDGGKRAYRRLREVRRAVATLVGNVSEVDWLTRNELE